VLENDTLRPPLAPLTDASRTKLGEILREAGVL
jgi:hypothetical protein